MRVLYLTTEEVDYLQDNTLVGLRTLLGADLVDWPKKEAVYANYNKPSIEMYGNGFTAWKILPDIDVDRTNIERKIKSGDFDFVIFSSVHRQTRTAYDFLVKGLFFSRSKFVFLDGEDFGRLSWHLLPFGRYYKRERNFYNHSVTRPISFSIPDCKVNSNTSAKADLFAKHVQCECAYEIEWVRDHCQKKYAFETEKAYYENIAQAYYAITMKKAGWDCMRHYEIAANGTVPAFYQLDRKPSGSAPHGLKDMENCLSFENAQELVRKIESVNKADLYPKLLAGAKKWIMQNQCSTAARRLLIDLQNL